jgi:hypothetical protein
MDALTARLPRVTVGLLMRVVAYSAVGLGIVVPMFRMNRSAGDSIAFPLIGSAVALPLAWSGLSFLLFWRGPVRDRLVLGFLLASVLATLMIFAGILGFTLWELGPSIFEDMTIESFAFGLGFFLILAASAWFLGRRLVHRPGGSEP